MIHKQVKKLLLLIFLIAFSGFSQNTDDSYQPNFWDNVRFGGGFGLGFGSNATTISIAPSAIYEFSDMFAAGLGGSYLYAKRGDQKSNVFGASVISLFNPIDNIQLSAEFEQLFVSQRFGLQKNSFNYPALYLGLAYRSGWFAIGMRYDVIYDPKSIYSSALTPIFRFYF